MFRDNLSVPFLTPCRWATQKSAIAITCIVDGSRISTLSSWHPACPFVSWFGSLFASRLSTAWCRMLGSQVTNKQTGHDPLFLEIQDCNKGTIHSDTLSVFLQLQSWLYVGMFCKRMIFCVSYMRIHILMSLIIATMKVWTVTVRSPQLVHVNNCDLLLVHWPHNFHTHFSPTSIKTIFVTVWD